MTDKTDDTKTIEIDSHEALLAIYGQPQPRPPLHSFGLMAVRAYLFKGEQNEDDR